jgi:OOP family OmpA-OmpF porin
VLTVIFASATLWGCSFSASIGNMQTLEGKNNIEVSATQPKLPPPPPPAPKPKAVITETSIEISEKVMFDYDKATIKDESHDLLNDVAKVMIDNPRVKKIRIEGHTDSDGKAKYNKELSQRRADAVMQYLISAGVDASRMEAVGFGEEKPIADNSTPEGKEANRRVEFNIIDQGLKAQENKN